MSHTDPAPEEQFKQIRNAFGKLFEGITPWLVEFGSWLFGGLIAFNLIVIAPLIPIGPVDAAILVSTTAFALALPLEVAGLFLLRLERDLKQVRFEEEVAQAFQEVRFTSGEQVASPTDLKALHKRSTVIVMSYCLGILMLSLVLTLTGMMAALWHLAWWIGVTFLAMVLISPGLVIAAITTSRPPDPARDEKPKQALAPDQNDEERA